MTPSTCAVEPIERVWLDLSTGSRVAHLTDADRLKGPAISFTSPKTGLSGMLLIFFCIIQVLSGARLSAFMAS